MQGPSAWHIFAIESKLGFTFSTRLIRKLGRDYFRFRNFKQQTKRKCKRRKKGRKITFEDKTSENATNGAVGREIERRESRRERDKPHTTLSRLFSFHIFIWPSISPSLSLAFVPSSSIYHFFHSCSNKSHPFQSLSHSLASSSLQLSSSLHSSPHFFSKIKRWNISLSNRGETLGGIATTISHLVNQNIF